MVEPRKPADLARAADLFAAAAQRHQAGRPTEAEALYRQALALDPRHVEGLHAFGVLAYQTGRNAMAAELIGQAVALNDRVAGYHANLGLALQDQGRLEEAAASHRRAIALDGRVPGFHNNLATALKALGRLDEAAEACRRAIALKPDYATAHNTLGNILREQGEPEAAAASYRRALALNPALAEAAFNLALVLQAQGALEEAADAYRAVLALRPDLADAQVNLGAVLGRLGRLDEAIEACRRALALRPDLAEAHYNLGAALVDLGKPGEAAEACRRAIALKPDHAGAHNNLGVALMGQGRPDAAEAAYRRAVALTPDYAEAHDNLGVALRDQGRPDEAEAAHRRALVLKPDYAEAHNNLGVALQLQGRLGEAVEAYGRALALQPDHVGAHYNLGLALQDQGRVDEAAASFARAVAVKPDYVAADSARVFCLNYSSSLPAEAIMAEHLGWGERHGARPAPAEPAFANDRDPGRRLRVGYVSRDFWDHPVGRFLADVFANHDHAAVETFGYADSAEDDAMTARLRGSLDRWRSLVGLTDAEAAAAIREDRIDILVDLAGHTVRNRLLMFALRPAPVQASWLGYPNTTGLAAMDYRLVDPVSDPPGAADGLAREKLVRLEGGFLCYAPPGDAPPPAPPPCLASGTITFGSFNNPPKLSDRTVEVWAALLARTPGARLLLKGRPFGDKAACSMMRDRFARHGIDPSRLELKAWIEPAGSHLAAYERVDVGLDPFPYNGTTTTCEALWMGVPVVTLAGDRHAGRVGASLLTQAGLPELIAADADAYLDIAAGLAADPARLGELRTSLRPRMAASPLCDGPLFVRALETAFRGMWRRWCAGGPPAAFDVPVQRDPSSA